MIPHVAYPPTLVGQFLCRTCGHVHATREPSCSRCEARDVLGLIHAWQEWKKQPRQWLLRGDVRALLNASAKMLAEYERLDVLHPQYVAFENMIVSAYDPKEIAKLPRSYEQGSVHEGDGSYVVPGVITLLEFRVRYGYTCRRVSCTHCQDVHSRGMGQRHRCKNDEDSGTRYRVRRADGTSIIVELSATKAWAAAHQREQPRFEPLLIVRDALTEGRIAEALEIADQLSPDLAVPLRREVARTIVASKFKDAR